MLRTLFPALTAIVVVAVLAPVAPAEDRRMPAPGADPETLFKRLDANQDGQLVLDEIPDRAPDWVKAVLRRADTNDDKKITAEEFKAAASRRRPGPPATGERQSRRPDPSAQRGRPQPPGASLARRPGGPPAYGRMYGAMRGRMYGMYGRMHGPMWGRMAGPGRQGPPFAARPPGAGLPDPKAVFARLDKDNDKKLSLEEFSEGMKAFHGRGVPPFPGRGGPAAMRHGFGPPAAGPPHGPPFPAGEGFKRAELARRLAAARAAGGFPETRTPEARKKIAEELKKRAEAARAKAVERRGAQAGAARDPEAMKKAIEARKKRAAEAKKRVAEEKKAPRDEKPESDQ